MISNENDLPRDLHLDAATNVKSVTSSGFDKDAYEKWRKDDEILLLECLTKSPGAEGCRLYETKRRKLY